MRRHKHKSMVRNHNQKLSNRSDQIGKSFENIKNGREPIVLVSAVFNSYKVGLERYSI